MELFSSLPRDIFFLLIESQGVIGKHLFSLALTCRTLNSMCNAQNQEIFRRLLLKEYGEEAVGDILHRSKYRLKYFIKSQETIHTFGLVTTTNTKKRAKQVVVLRHHIVTRGMDDMLFNIGKVSQETLQIEKHWKQTFVYMSVVEYHGFAAIAKDGLLYTSGNNSWGKIGHNTPRELVIEVPLPIHHFKYPKQVCCGFSFTLVLDANNEVWLTGLTSDVGKHLANEMHLWRRLVCNVKIAKIYAEDIMVAMIDVDGDLHVSDANGVIFLLYADVKWKEVALGPKTLLISTDGQLYGLEQPVRSQPVLIKGPWESVRHISISPYGGAVVDNLSRLWLYFKKDDSVKPYELPKPVMNVWQSPRSNLFAISM